MKLGALGLVTVAIGAALSSVGLVGIGAFWVVMGVVAHTLRPRMELRRTDGVPPDKGRFWLGVGVMLAVGLPSLVVGIAGLGIDDGDSAWRWLPLGVGILMTGFGVTSGLLFGAATGLSAVSGPGVPEEHEPTGVGDRLAELERLLRDEQITLDEYRTRRERLLGSL